MDQHDGFDPVVPTASSPRLSQQKIPSNPAAYAQAISNGLPHQSWPNENIND
jgi:hypothetical protein